MVNKRAQNKHRVNKKRRKRWEERGKGGKRGGQGGRHTLARDDAGQEIAEADRVRAITEEEVQAVRNLRQAEGCMKVASFNTRDQQRNKGTPA